MGGLLPRFASARGGSHSTEVLSRCKSVGYLFSEIQDVVKAADESAVGGS